LETQVLSQVWVYHGDGLRAAAMMVDFFENFGRTWIGLTGVALLAAIIVVAVLIGNVTPHPREQVVGATAVALFGYLLLDAGIGAFS
jgi:hypothetical protein